MDETMTQPIRASDELLELLKAGRLDALTADEVERLEAGLNERPQEIDGVLARVAADDLPNDWPAPSESEWRRAWVAIERETSGYGYGGPWRIWRGLAAAAACVLAALSWRFDAQTPAATPQIQLANQVDIQELEVFGDAFAAVSYSGETGGAAVIWVFEGDQGV